MTDLSDLSVAPHVEPTKKPALVGHEVIDPLHESWCMLADAVRRDTAHAGMVPAPWRDVFEPLFCGGETDVMVLAQLGQSLDGRIATRTGHSKYINGMPGLIHLHRLRAVVDAVMVGIGTALADDPLLNVRMVPGRHPHRIVIDPRGRLKATARLLNLDDGVRRIVLTTADSVPKLPSGVEIVRLPSEGGLINPLDIRKALAELGIRRVLLEGGAETISRFLSAKALDRLHVIVAPVILGDGRAGLVLPPIETVDQALRPPTKTHVLEGEVLFDCDFRGLGR
jgi:diaminohydroxyphosphoribosylaminopyrimidine deaminase / 5-amino-6-(5-phosphoribosylamino)uracil reductase